MLGNFTYHNPTKLYFGENAIDRLAKAIAPYGKRVLLVYGGGSIKKNGIYDRVLSILQDAGKEVYEDAGVMPNPTTDKLAEGIERARACDAEFILAVGGGSVCDYAKALAASVHATCDPWEEYFVNQNEPTCPTVPLGCVLTMVGTGSEMNGGSVITNPAEKMKVAHNFKADLFPRFAILDPTYTYTLPYEQMVAGIFDIFSHICEQYFSGDDDNTSDYIMEGLMRSLIHSSKIAVKNPLDYEARSNIMWTATWALNTLVSRGKATDWMVHMFGHAVSAYTNATHGMTLAAITLPYFRHILPYGLHKFRRFAVNVFDVPVAGKSDEEIALAGLAALESWMRTLGVAMDIASLGATEEMLEGMADATFINEGGYKILTRDEVISVLREALYVK